MNSATRGHRIHHRARSQADLELFRRLVDGVERVGHDLLQSLIDLLLGPGKRLQRLDPFEVRDSHAARIGKDVRETT